MLKGKRVTLRGVRKEDLFVLWEFNNELEVQIARGGSPPLSQSLERLQADFDSNVSKGGRDGTWFVIDAEEKVIGECGLTDWSDFRGVAHSCEIAITIGDKDYWGRGYGREVVWLLLEYAFIYWNCQRVGIRTHSDNERAIRCYKACCFIEDGRLRRRQWQAGRYVDTVCMSILREEWEFEQQTRKGQRSW